MPRWFFLSIGMILLGSVVYADVYDVYGEPEDDIVVPDCEDIAVTCTCGIGDTENTKEFKQKQLTVRTELGKTECRSPFDPYLICANHSCALKSSKIEKREVSNPMKMKRNIVQTFYPQEIVIPRGGNSSLARSERQAEPCSIPTLKNAEIKCWKWPNWINCDVTCIYGYALADKSGSVKSTNMNCRLTENQWKPHGFEDCQPYVNCKAHLTKPGDLKCKEPTDGPAYCEISCLDYDQYEATSLQKYECVDEGFAKTLPHCAVLTDIPLAHKPAK